MPRFSPFNSKEFNREMVGLCPEEVLPVSCCYRADMGRISLMDALDRKILAELQKNGRISATELAERVGLSLSPCHRRLRALEEAGVITGYRANVVPAAVGLNFSAVIL
jgi:predicted transcriptional regulator